MRASREEVSEFVLSRLREGGQVFGDDISEDMYLFNSMSFQSLEIVVLATEIQEHFGEVIPFNTLFEEVAQRESRDLTVREWVDFVHASLGTGPAWQPANFGDDE